MRKTAKYVLGALVLLFVILVVKTFLYTSKQPKVGYAPVAVADSGAADRLQTVIRLQTVSYDDSLRTDTAAFAALHKQLKVFFPLVYSRCTVTKHHKFALLFELKGQNPALKPIVLMAHQDVVPVDTVGWLHAPFAAFDDGTYIWGRGTLDNKGSMMAILEAVERRLQKGFVPERTVYMAFGDDEETVGNGAKAIAAYLQAKGVTAEMVLDEGLAITKGMVPMVKNQVALIGTSEKGYATYKLTVDEDGGHSSTPKHQTSITIMSRAITDVNRRLPQSRIVQPVEDFISYLGPEVPWPARIIFANQWLFNPLIKSIYKQTPGGNALVSTTIAATVFKAGEKENAIPSESIAILNSRILPGTTPEEVRHHIERSIKNNQVKITPLTERMPSAVSPISTPAFAKLSNAVAMQFADTYVMPSLMLAASDARSYSGVSKNIYRFAPYVVDDEDLNRIHGNNERIKKSDYLAMIGFYEQLLAQFER